MKRLILALLSFVIIGNLSAQLESYPIQDYQRPDLKRKTLGINGSLNGFGPTYQRIPIGIPSDIRNESYLNSRFTLFYNSLEVSRKTIKTLAHFLSNYNQLDFRQGHHEISINQQFSMNKQNFFDEKKFFEWSPSITSNLNFDNSHSSLNIQRFSMGSKIAMGSGRKELINDAVHALRIYAMLTESGNLEGTPSHEQITAFAQQIGRIKNERVLDARHKRIYEYEEVTKFLEMQGLFTNSVSSIAHLIDAWRNELVFNRFSGKSLSFGLNPRGRYDLYDSNNYYNYNLFLEVEYENCKPIDSKWQHDQSYLFGIGTGNANIYFTGGYNFMKEVGTKFNFNQLLTYFQSARTNYTLNFNASAFVNLSSDQQFLTTSLFLNQRRWISRQLNFTINAGVYYSNFNLIFNHGEIISPSFNISLNYNWF